MLYVKNFNQLRMWLIPCLIAKQIADDRIKKPYKALLTEGDSDNEMVFMATNDALIEGQKDDVIHLDNQASTSIFKERILHTD